MTASEAIRMLAGIYARYRRGDISDRAAHAEAVIVQRRRERAKERAVVERRGEGFDFITIYRLDDDKSGAADDRGLDSNALEADVMNRGLRGELTDAAMKRELFIIDLMKKALDEGADDGDVIPRVKV